MIQRNQLWMQTYTGLQFYPYDPKPDQICIEDIAQSLSGQCRYNAHLDMFYSVAQHSYITSLLVDEKYAFCALMHDATETYLSDLPHPVKAGLPEYKALEDDVWKVIAKKYGLPEKIPAEVKLADMQLLMAEQRDVGKDYGYDWGYSDIKVPDMAIKPLTRAESKAIFLGRFEELYDNIDSCDSTDKNK